MNKDLQIKKDFVNECMKRYGKYINEECNPSADIFNLKFEELMAKYSRICQIAEFDMSAIKI